ncbi:MAG: hypothetical protein AABW59_01365 [archaeon]
MPIMRKRVNEASAKMNRTGKTFRLANEIYADKYKAYVGKVRRGQEAFRPVEPLANAFEHAASINRYSQAMARRQTPLNATVRLVSTPKAALRLARMKLQKAKTKK